MRRTARPTNGTHGTIDRNRVYTRTALMRALGLAEHGYRQLRAKGLPTTKISGKGLYHSGRLVAEWLETYREDD